MDRLRQDGIRAGELNGLFTGTETGRFTTPGGQALQHGVRRSAFLSEEANRAIDEMRRWQLQALSWLMGGEVDRG